MFVTPNFCIRIVFSFSWELKWPQEKLKTMLMQNFGVTNKEHYGMLWYFWSGQYKFGSVKAWEEVLGLIFAGYVPLAFQSPDPIITVYFVANNRPHLSHFWANVIFVIPP